MTDEYPEDPDGGGVRPDVARAMLRWRSTAETAVDGMIDEIRVALSELEGEMAAIGVTVKTDESAEILRALREQILTVLQPTAKRGP